MSKLCAFLVKYAKIIHEKINFVAWFKNQRNKKPKFLLRMVRYITLIICLLFCVKVYTQPKLCDNIQVHVPFCFTPVDLDAISIAEELSADSLKTGDEVYYKDNWSTTQIRYAQDMLPDRDDTVAIILIGRSDNPFCPPVKGKVISKFGRRGGRIHTGTDFKLNSGDTVRCAFDGRVRLAKRFSGYGNLVLVRHKNGLETIYAHLKSIAVNVNDTLQAGDVVGLGGRTGRATTDHLHFETRFLGEPFDSGKYIDLETFALNSSKIYYKNHQFETDPANFKRKTAGRAMMASTEGAGEHIICRGDNLWTIARRYRTTINRLCEVNGISRHEVLRTGNVLKIN